MIATARRQEQVEETAIALESRGRKRLRIQSDVCDRASLERLHDEIIKAFGKVDILINCAGRIKRAPTRTFPEEEWTEIIDTNLTGTLRACQIFAKSIFDRGYGRIINFASLNSFVAFSEVAAYAASKAGVVSLTRSLAVEWSKKGVTVNAIAPGVFRTDLNSVPRWNATRPGASDAHPHGPLRQDRRACRLGRIPRFRCRLLHHRPHDCVDGGFLASGVNQ